MKDNLYKIFQNKLTKKIITIVYSVIFFIAFSYYYYHHDYFKILLVVSVAGIIVVLLLYIYKKINVINHSKEIFHKELNFNLSKIIIIFIGLAILILNLSLLTKANGNLKYMLANIFSIELNIIYQITTILLFNIIFILILWSIGNRIIKLLKLNNLTGLEEFIFGFAFGAVPLIFSIFLLAITNLLYTKFILINLAIWLLFSYKEIIENLKKINKLKVHLPPLKNFTDINFYKKIVILILFMSIIFLFIESINPQPLDYDSLHTYYNAPKLSLEQHKLVKFPLFPFANIPKNIEMLYMNIMAITSPRFLSHIQLIYFALTLLTIYLFCKKFFNKKTGLLATMICFLAPTILYLSKTTKIDISLIFYSILIIYIFFIWLDKPKIKWAIIMGSLFGLSFGIKYNGILLFISVISTIFIIIIYRLAKKKECKKYIYQSLIIILFTIILFSPWLIRNKAEFNNYSYPFSINSNSSTKNPLVNKKKDEYTKIFYQKEKNEIKRFINFPKTYLKSSAHSRLQNFSPIFLIGLLLLFLYRKNYKEKILIIIFSVYFILWFLKANHRIWYGVPILPLLSVLIASAIIKVKFLLKNNIIKFSLISYLIICLILISNFDACHLYYITGIISKKQYLNKIQIFNISNKLNSIIEKNEKVLLIWDMRIGFIKNNNKNTFVNSKNEKFFNYAINKNPTEVYNSLKEKNIKYIIYRHKRENLIKNLPYKTNLNLLNNESYKNILKGLNLFDQFKTKYLEKIECSQNNNKVDIECLYKVI